MIVGDGVAVSLGVGDGMTGAVCVADGVAVGVGVSVLSGVIVAVGVIVGVCVVVGVGVAVGVGFTTVTRTAGEAALFPCRSKATTRNEYRPFFSSRVSQAVKMPSSSTKFCHAT